MAKFKLPPVKKVSQKIGRTRVAQIAALKPWLKLATAKPYAPFLEVTVPFGTYELDEFFRSPDGGKPDADELTAIRSHIDRCAKIAIRRVERELIALPKMQDQKQRLDGVLAKIVRLAEPLLEKPAADDLAADLAFLADAAKAPSPVAAYDQIIDALQHVKEHAQAVRNVKLRIPPSTQVLARALVDELGQYLHRRGEKVKRSRVGRLAKLAAATWTDCKFPPLRPNEGALELFGSFAERFKPRLPPKKAE